MSKVSYLVALLAILGFGTYALWPTPTVVGVKLFSGPTPTSYTVRVATTSVRVSPEQTTITIGNENYIFATDIEKIGRIWTTLSGIEVPPTKVIADIGEAQLQAYGLDDTREVSATSATSATPATGDGLRIRWGGKGGQAYVWNALDRKLFAVDPQALPGLDAAAAPPIRANVLAHPQPPTRLTIDGLALVNQDGQWLAELFRNRPPFNTRVASLLGQLSRVSINEFPGAVTFGLPVVGTVQMPEMAGSPVGVPAQMAIGAQPARAITVYADGARGVVAIAGYPAQRVSDVQLTELRAAFAAFARNPLLDLYTVINRDDVLRVDITRGTTPWWSLRRREKPPAIGGFFWDVAWGNGRESAPDDAVDRLAKMLADISVREPQPDSQALAKLPDDALVITVETDRPNAQPVRVAIAGGELISAAFRGRLNDDNQLRLALAPERFLDQRLTRRDPSRVAKIQRRFRAEAPPRDEVVMRTEGGTWVRTYPANAVPGATVVAGSAVAGSAVDRLIRVLSGARVEDLALISGDGKKDEKGDDARALLANPDFEMDIRFAAVAGGQASNDETDLDLTAAQDWGFAARKDSQRWQCVDKDLGLRFTLDDDTVEEFRRAFDAGQVFPVVGSVVTRVDVKRTDGTLVTLVRNGADWTASSSTEAAKPADAIAVRRYFRTLGSLSMADGAALDARVPEPAAAEVVASISCTVPAIGGDTNQPSELLTLAILRPVANGTPVHVWSNRGGSRFPRGRAVVPSVAVAEVLPDVAAFSR